VDICGTYQWLRISTYAFSQSTFIYENFVVRIYYFNWTILKFVSDDNSDDDDGNNNDMEKKLRKYQFRVSSQQHYAD